jgi:DNA repair exonuclease SbcCD nuclease subunit
MPRFIHAADIHLDSPLRGLERYEGCPVERVRNATRDALIHLVDLCLDKHVDFLVLAGDLYDGDWKDFGTGLFFIKQMARLQAASIPVFVIAGNHDAANKMTRSLPLPETVRMLRSDRPETIVLEDLGVAVHGQSFANQAVLEDLSANYPRPLSGLFNLGILHTSCTGREGHEKYAPCTVEGLRDHGYDYWALGHIHLRETLSERPYIGFSGNIQGRHIRETGPKGCNLVEFDSRGSLSVEFQPLDVVRWERFTIDVSRCESTSDVFEQFAAQARIAVEGAQGRLVCTRVHLVGESNLHTRLQAAMLNTVSELRAVALDVASDSLWIEKVLVETSLPRSAGESSDIPDDAISEVLSVLKTLREQPEQLLSGPFDLSEIWKKLPADLQEPMEQLAMAHRSQWLDQTRDRLLSTFTQKQSGP